MSWVITSPAVVNDKVVYGTSDSRKLFALNKVDGDSIWLADGRAFLFSSPAVTEDLVIIGTFAGELLGFDISNGDLLWEWHTDARNKNDQNVVNPDGSINYEVVFTGNQYKDQDETLERLYSSGSILSSPVIRDSVIYFGSTDGFLYALK